MAYFTPTHGDLRPVVNVDLGQNSAEASLNEVTDGVTVNLAGPKLQFGTITKGSGAFTGAQIKTIIDTLQQLATVYMYEYTDDTNDSLAVALYPAAAWDFTNGGSAANSVDSVITAALGAVAVTTAAGAAFSG